MLNNCVLHLLNSLSRLKLSVTFILFPVFALCIVFTHPHFLSNTYKPKLLFQVLVGGESCTILSVTDDEIKCELPSKPEEQPMYSGGRGVKVEIFPGISDFSAELNTSSEDCKCKN